MTTKAKRKVRKPAPYCMYFDYWGKKVICKVYSSVGVGPLNLDAKAARKHAAWLIKAADYLEQQENK